MFREEVGEMGILVNEGIGVLVGGVGGGVEEETALERRQNVTGLSIPNSK